jgi:hypothetical protein
VADEDVDLHFEIAGQVVVLQQNAFLQRLVPALDLALDLRMTRRAADMMPILVSQPFSQIASNVAGPIVGEQPWTMPYAPDRSLTR